VWSKPLAASDFCARRSVEPTSCFSWCSRLCDPRSPAITAAVAMSVVALVESISPAVTPAGPSKNGLDAAEPAAAGAPCASTIAWWLCAPPAPAPAPCAGMPIMPPCMPIMPPCMPMPSSSRRPVLLPRSSEVPLASRFAEAAEAPAMAAPAIG